MYKLILVDDESEICEGLKEIVPFEALGFTVVGEAGNGVEALQLCESLEPDLIITDIRMPLMDGLTLCRQVRAISPTTQFIILSGYDDFEYARQAIEVKTMGYLLKPISSAEFIEMLKNAKLTLDEQFSSRRDVNRLREHFRDSLPVLREMMLSSLLSGAISPEVALGQAGKYGLNLNAERYEVALVKLGDTAGDAGIDDPELRLFAVRNILCEVLEAHRDICPFRVFMHNGLLALLFLLSQETVSSLPYLEEARKTVKHYLSCPLFLGLSAPFDALSAAPAAAAQALSAMDQALLAGQEQVLMITDIEQASGDSLRIDDLLLRQLINSTKAGEMQQAEAALSRLMDACRVRRVNPKAYQTYLMEIFMGFVRIVPELSLEWQDLGATFDQIMQKFFQSCPTVDEAQEELLHLLHALAGAIQSHRKTSSLLLSSQAEEYLQNNYAQPDLSLEKLCLHLHISPSYFSTLFKKETKKTFHQYLTELRMDQALTLLSSSELKTAQIAERVGLPDPSYFSYCFKKHFGFPPSQARKPH